MPTENVVFALLCTARELNQDTTVQYKRYAAAATMADRKLCRLPSLLAHRNDVLSFGLPYESYQKMPYP